MEKKVRIDFIGVGFGRSGSRWLNQCLSEHPKISLPKRTDPKRSRAMVEINYFPDEYEVNGGLKQYKNFFKECDFTKLVGEISTQPIMFKRSAKMIKELFPDVKIIIYQRDEEKRAQSHNNARKYSMLIDEPYQKINQEEYIAPFRQEFGKNLFIFNMENPDRVQELNKLFDFLRIGHFKCPSTYVKVNAGYKPVTYRRTRKVINYLRERLRKHKKIYFFLKRKLKLDEYYQILNSNL